MTHPLPRHRRTAIFAAAVALSGLATTACDAGRATTPPTTSTSVLTTATQHAASADRMVAQPSTTAATPRTLTFTDRDLDVVFTAYDPNDKMVRFHEVVQDPAAHAAHLVPDPSDPVAHELPMEPGATVASIDPLGFPFETCPPTSCTVNEVMSSVIGHYDGQFWAYIHVDGSDRIDAVRQSAY